MKCNFFIPFLILLIFSIIPSAGQEYYTYYGYIPSRMWYAQPKIATHGTFYKGVYNITYVQFGATLTLVGWHDDTKIEVYTLPDENLVYSATINRMEKVHVFLPNGTFFKLQASKPVFSLLTAGELNRTQPSWPATIVGFIPSTDGAAVGKEFIFMSIQKWDETPYRFRALEDSQIKIMDSSGATVKAFKLAANTYKDIALKSFKVYHVTSTGNIEIQSYYGVRTRYIPSITGSYIGTTFYTTSNNVWNPLISHGFMLIGQGEDAKVTIYDVEYKKKIFETEVPARGKVFVTPETVRMRLLPYPEILIKSDKPIMVCHVHHGAEPGTSSHIGGGDYGTGVVYLPIKANQPTMVYVPINCTSESYIFAYKDTNVIVDGLQIRLEADHYLPLQQGLHEIRSDADVLIQITHWPNIPAFQGLYDFSSIIPAVQMAGVKKNVKAVPLVGGGPSYTLYGGIAAAIVALAAIAFFIRSRRARS